jgi:magnesium transporter
MSGAAAAGRNLNDPIVRHIRTDFPRLHIKQTVGEALTAIRENPPEGRIIYFYVVDDENRLRGVVPTRRLLLSSPDVPLGDIMVREVIVIPSTATILDACEFFIFHRLLACPVVDAESRLLGIVDVELYTDELSDLDRKAGSDELFQLIGVHLTDARVASPVYAFRSRFPWLLTNIAGGILAALMLGVFRAELETAVALALFIPVVLALSESVSIQSLSLALQALRGREPTVGAILKKLKTEIMTGLFLGAASGTVVGIAAIMWLGRTRVAWCLLGGIGGGVTCAATIGAAMPYLLRLFQREPHVAAGPIVLASVDMATLLIYFTTARLLLG